jgi:hypothetical protein
VSSPDESCGMTLMAPNRMTPPVPEADPSAEQSVEHTINGKRLKTTITRRALMQCPPRHFLRASIPVPLYATPFKRAKWHAVHPTANPLSPWKTMRRVQTCLDPFHMVPNSLPNWRASVICSRVQAINPSPHCCSRPETIETADGSPSASQWIRCAKSADFGGQASIWHF